MDVERLRKEVLPHAAKLRQLLVESVKLARNPQNADMGAYVNALAALKEKHKRTTSEVRELWRKLGFKTIEAASSTAVGLSLTATPGGWAAVIETIAISFLVNVVRGAAADAQKLLAATKTQKASPLFFFDVLPDIVEKQVRKHVE